MNKNNITKLQPINKIDQMYEQFINLVDNFDYNNPPPPQSFLVKGLIPDAKVSLLSGEGAAGKTHQLLDLCQKIAYPISSVIKDKWLGSEVLGFGKVIYVSAEETREDFHSRLCDLGCGERKTGIEHNIYLIDKTVMAQKPLFSLKGDNVCETDSFIALKLLSERVKPKLIVIDTLNSLCPVNIDSSTAHAQAVMQRLGIIAASCGASIIVTHHVSKAGEITNKASARKAIKGTTGTVDGARNAIVLWECPERIAKPFIEHGICKHASELFSAAVVKSNVKGSFMGERYFIKNHAKGGILEQVMDIPKSEEKPKKTTGRKKEV